MDVLHYSDEWMIATLELTYTNQIEMWMIKIEYQQKKMNRRLMINAVRREITMGRAHKVLPQCAVPKELECMPSVHSLLLNAQPCALADDGEYNSIHEASAVVVP